MKPLLALVFSLVVFLSGCGTESTPTVQETPTPSVTERSTPTVQETSTPAAKEKSTPVAQETLSPSELADAIAEIKKLGGKVKFDESGEVIEVRLSDTKITDAGLGHLKGLTKLKRLSLQFTQ
ncbi:MAG: hypothetical protein COA78_29315, partial [Blastopirellula sp.]